MRSERNRDTFTKTEAIAYASSECPTRSGTEQQITRRVGREVGVRSAFSWCGVDSFMNARACLQGVPSPPLDQTLDQTM